ncbi:MAG: hypothetical protein ACOYKE_02540 [Ferruginibacter sp.]
MESAKERIRQFIDYKSITVNDFCKKNLLSNSFFNNPSAIGADKLLKIFRNFPELNMDWVVTGRGTMLYTPVQNTPSITGRNIDAQTIKNYRKEIDKINNDLHELVNTIEGEIRGEGEHTDEINIKP